MTLVIFVEPTIKHYRLPFLRALRDELARDGVELRAVCARHDERGTFDDEPGMPVPTRRVDERTLALGGARVAWMSLFAAVRDADLVVVPQHSKQLSFYGLLAWQRLGGPRIALWGHGFTPWALTARSSAGRRLKEAMSRAASWWFAYTPSTAETVVSFGYPRERVTVVDNATDTTSLRALLADVTDEEVHAFRRAHGLGGGPVVLFLGSLRPDKSIDYLVEAGRHLVRRRPDARLLLAGGGPLEHRVRRLAGQHQWLAATGAVARRDLAVVLRTADLIVCPTAVGLVAVDSFAAGLPLVTRPDTMHGPEIDYVEDGKNGLLVRHAERPEVFADAVADLLDDGDRLRELQRGAATSGERFSSERMAALFADGVRRALRA